MYGFLFEWLLKIFKNKWTWIILVFIILVGYGYTNHVLYVHQRKQAKQWKANFQTTQSKVDSSLDLLGRKQYIIKQLQFTTRQFKQQLENKNTILHKYLKEIQASRIKIRHLKKFISANISSNNSGVSVIHDTIIDSLRKHSFKVSDGYLFFHATWLMNDSIHWNYLYKEKVYVWTIKKRDMKTKKGKKRFFLARWFVPRWKIQVHIKSNNPKSLIKATQVNIFKN